MTCRHVKPLVVQVLQAVGARGQVFERPRVGERGGRALSVTEGGILETHRVDDAHMR